MRERLRRIAFDGAGRASCLGRPELYKVFVCSRLAWRAALGINYWQQAGIVQARKGNIVADFSTMRALEVSVTVLNKKQVACHETHNLFLYVSLTL